jgi:hypothetical protein
VLARRNPPGRRGELPPLTPLRTGREGFPSPGSSISKAVVSEPANRTSMLTARYWTEAGSLMGKVAPAEQVRHHLQHLLGRFFGCFRAETPEGSQPAFASGDLSTRVRPITGRHSLFPSSSTRTALGRPCGSPTPVGERYGLTVFRWKDRIGLGSLCAPTAFLPMPGDGETPGPAALPFWPKPDSIFGLLLFTTLYREFADANLAVQPRPSPPDAGRDTVPSRFRCSRYRDGSIVRGLSTARYLAALPRRLVLIGQQVRSGEYPAGQSFQRLHVAIPAAAGGELQQAKRTFRASLTQC